MNEYRKKQNLIYNELVFKSNQSFIELGIYIYIYIYIMCVCIYNICVYNKFITYIYIHRKA